MANTTENNKRIVKNTAMLYFRMLIVVLVSLYTSRVVLQQLGVEDFGIYNVVGGFVTIFGFLRSSLSNATQRFLSFGLGKGCIKDVGLAFNTSLIVYFILSVFVVLLLETVGLWFVCTKLVIPEERFIAALWTYQFAILSLFITLNSIVFNSVLIARENMKAYAYIGIIEAILKLIIALLICYSTYDKLITYSFLFMFTSFIVQLAYFQTSRKYPETKICLNLNGGLIKRLTSFIGWNAFTTAVWTINNQGINVLLNMFFGPSVNAARSIANQVNACVHNFALNFTTALKPQVTKSFAKQDYNYYIDITFMGCKYSVFMMFVLCLPFMIRTDYILGLWLGYYPEYTVSFTQLALVFTILDVFTNPIFIAVQATGKLKNYCLFGDSVFLLAFPIAYLSFRVGLSPNMAFFSLIIARIVYVPISIILFRRLCNFRIFSFVKEVVFPVLVVALISTPISLLLSKLFPNTLIYFFVFVVLSCIATSVTTIFLGMSNRERTVIYNSTILRRKNSKNIYKS